MVSKSSKVSKAFLAIAAAAMLFGCGSVTTADNGAAKFSAYASGSPVPTDISFKVNKKFASEPCGDGYYKLSLSLDVGGYDCLAYYGTMVTYTVTYSGLDDMGSTVTASTSCQVKTDNTGNGSSSRSFDLPLRSINKLSDGLTYNGAVYKK